MEEWWEGEGMEGRWLRKTTEWEREVEETFLCVGPGHVCAGRIRGLRHYVGAHRIT